MTRLFIFGAACVALSTAALAGDAVDKDAIDAVAENYMTAPIAGMTIAVARPGQPAFIRAYGFSDVESEHPMRADTRFEIGSITKQFTAAAVLKLVEQGRLSLDAPVARFFPELAERARGATLAHLLHHSSGLSSARAVEDLTAPADPRAIVTRLADRPSEFAPGEKYRYNNNGYILVGLIVERVTGLPFARYLHNSIIGPLGLESTSECVPGELPSYLPPSRDGETFRRAPSHHPTAGFSAGFLCSTAGDLARWTQALMTGQVVSPDSVAAMSTPTTGTAGVRTNYGIGMEIAGEGEDLRLMHSGATSGFFAQSGHWPHDGTTVVVLTNAAYAGSLLERIQEDVHQASLGNPPTYLPGRVSNPDPLVGTYAIGEMPVLIYAQDGYLRMQPAGQTPARLLQREEGAFVAEHDPAVSVRFALGPSGQATSLRIEQGGRALPPAVRVQQQ